MTLELSGYHECLEALRHGDLAQALYDDGRLVMADTLITLHGEIHQARRRLERTVFNQRFFRHYEHTVFPETVRETLQPYLREGNLDVVEFSYRVVMNLTADFAGIDRPRKTPEETETLLRLVKTFSEGATLVHSTRDKREVEAEVTAALNDFDAQFLKPSRARREGRVEPALDVLTVLLQNQDSADLPDAVLRREMAFYLQAGAHSTANSVTHALHELFEWMAGSQETRTRLLQDDAFLHDAVHESFRLHPASPVAWRRAVADCEVAGHRLQRGELLSLNFAAANLSAEIFGRDARQFNPGRSLRAGINRYGLTFGSGVHACLGRALDGGTAHQLGIVPSLVRTLLAAGANPDPDRPPVPDTHTVRQNWSVYPAKLGAA